MNAQLQSLQARTQYRFALIGLYANDARLFSSLFRLLSARMRHIWLPVATHEIRALTLVGDATTDEEIDTARMHGGILRIGNQVLDRERALCFPLRPTEIMNVFDRIGDALDREAGRSATASPTPHTSTAPRAAAASTATQIPTSVRAALAASTEITMSIGADGRVMGKPSAVAAVVPSAGVARTTAVANASALSATSSIKLLRWPSQQLLRESGDHLMLATLMVYRVTTIQELQQRSGLTERSCQLFVTRMLAEGHAVRVGIEVNNATPAKQNPAVDTRMSQVVASNTMLAANAKRQGIIAFIRRRLSI
jgi:hypothetical protein